MASVDEIIAATKSFETADLFKLLKVLMNETEKKCKQTVKTTATSKTVRKSTNNGAQLKKPRAWVEFTLKHALENGWEAFTITQKKKDKETGETIVEEIDMPCSMFHNECYVFEDSITEKTPDGRQLIHSHAMSLSKQRRENNHPSYAEFEAQYVNDDGEDTTDTTSTSSKKIIVKKTAAEKEAEKEEAKAAKEAAKAEAKAAKDAVKAEAKAAKAVKAVKATETKTEKAVKVTEVKKKSVTKVEDVPDDGMIHPWKFEGKNYLRNFDGETWTVGKGGSIGDWVGIYDVTTNTLDTSAEMPVFDDSE